MALVRLFIIYTNNYLYKQLYFNYTNNEKVQAQLNAGGKYIIIL